MDRVSNKIFRFADRFSIRNWIDHARAEQVINRMHMVRRILVDREIEPDCPLNKTTYAAIPNDAKKIIFDHYLQAEIHSETTDNNKDQTILFSIFSKKARQDALAEYAMQQTTPRVN